MVLLLAEKLTNAVSTAAAPPTILLWVRGLT